MVKHYLLASLSFFAMVASLFFLKLALAGNLWFLIPAAFIGPVFFAVFTVLSDKVWIHLLSALCSAIAIIVIFGARWPFFLIGLILICTHLWGFYRVRHDSKIFLEVNVAELSRRPVKMIMMALSLVFAVVVSQVAIHKINANEQIIPHAYQMEVLKLTVPDLNSKSTVDETLQALSNKQGGQWSAKTTENVLNDLGVEVSAICVQTNLIADCPEVVDALIGERIVQWLVGLGKLAQPSIALVAWQLLLALIYIVLPVVLAGASLLCKYLYKVGFFTFRHQSVNKYEIILRH